MAYLQGLRLE